MMTIPNLKSLGLHFVPLVLWTLLPSNGARADSGDRLCRLINYACGSSGPHSNTSNSYPAASDAHGTNPASIPTEKTPFGVELLDGGGKVDYGAFQGYGKFGLAASSITREHGFFSNASNLSAAGVELPEGTGEDLNRDNFQLGLAFPVLKERLKKWMVPYLGLGGRRYKESGHLRPAAGLAWAGPTFHLGAGISKNDSSRDVAAYNGGFSWKRISFDYSLIKNTEGINNSTEIYSLIYGVGRFTLIGAYRKQKIQTLTSFDRYLIELEQKSYHASHLFWGIQYQLNQAISFGYYINYVLEEGGFIGLRLALGSY